MFKFAKNIFIQLSSRDGTSVTIPAREITKLSAIRLGERLVGSVITTKSRVHRVKEAPYEVERLAEAVHQGAYT